MCGHGGLLVNVVFSLTGIFHGSAGGISSGHTWHRGTPERCPQIPLGKPGLVIPRCETLASRSVTFSLHQKESAALHPLSHPLFSCHEDLQLRVQRGKKKKCTAMEREHSLLHPTSSSKTWLRKGGGVGGILSDYIRSSLQAVAQTMRLFCHSRRSTKHLHSQVKNLVLYLCTIVISEPHACSCV